MTAPRTYSPRLAIFASFSGQGGVEKMIANLAAGFLDAGVAVDLVLARAQGEHLDAIPAGVRIVKLNVRHTFTALPGLARYLREEKPDAVLAAKDRAIRVALLARRLAGSKARLVGRLGTTVSAALKGKGRLRELAWFTGMRLFYPHLDAIVAVSQGVKDDILSITALPSERVRVIRNPVITPALERQAALPCDHPWPNDPAIPLIVGMGRLTRQKGFPDLIAAFARLRRDRICRLVIVGEGGDREKLERLADGLGVSEDVCFTGFLANPHGLIARCSLFVLSSLWEGSPNALTEAMALGRPVVSTDCPSGPAELLNGGEYGPLVPVGDVEALAAAMAHALDHPLPAECLRRAVAEYTQTISARRYLETLGMAP
ncbi:glycosyltransferase [Methylococcus capsulatus]|uniref:glycosyltransferase n=1 Tax=Methylococcus capsulatus TaxID=414 RepID=UPI0003711406|nr:glycosyltransferase [Methylococcus capsulatus]